MGSIINHTDAVCGRNQFLEWYTSSAAKLFRTTEIASLQQLIATIFGYYCVQIGWIGYEDELYSKSKIRQHVIVDAQKRNFFRYPSLICDVQQLSIATDSVDAVLLPHVIEFIGNTSQLMGEVERILIPEGRVVIVGFNPLNPWALWQLNRFNWANHNESQEFFSHWKVRDCLKVHGFEVESIDMNYFIMPKQGDYLGQHFKAMSDFTQDWCPFLYGCYVIVAQKTMSTFTLIKPRWRPRRSLLTAGVVEPTS